MPWRACLGEIMKNFLTIIGYFLFGVVPISVFMAACNPKTGPATPYDMPFTPTPTQIVRITGAVNVAVQDKSQAVTGLTVYAIPPSGAATYSAATTTTGIATFNPPYLEVGNWTFVVPAQTPYPYAPSTITMPVSVANEQANFNSAGASIQLTPPVPAAISGTGGGVFVYGVSYSQGNLLVPVKLAVSSLPANWSASYGPATFGFIANDTATVTVTGSGCVDTAASFSVTAMDLETTPYPRASGSPQTITKNFTSNLTVTWQGSSPFYNISQCNLEKKVNGTLVVSGSGECGTVSVWMTECSTNCYSGQFSTPNGNTSAQNAGGGSIQFGPGSYNCTVISDGCWPTLYAHSNINGATGSSSIDSSTHTILSTSY